MNEVDKAKIYAVYTRELDSGTNSVVAFRETLRRFPQYILDDVRDAIAHERGEDKGILRYCLRSSKYGARRDVDNR
jgi:hypothetical protein